MRLDVMEENKRACARAWGRLWQSCQVTTGQFLLPGHGWTRASSDLLTSFPLFPRRLQGQPRIIHAAHLDL